MEIQMFLLFCRQRKHNHQTQAVFHKVSLRVERVESRFPEVQHQIQLTTNLQQQVNNLGKQLPTAEDRLNLQTSLTRLDLIEFSLLDLQPQIQLTTDLQEKISALTSDIQ